LVPGSPLPPEGLLLCRLSLVNTGEAVWLDRAKWEKGEVRLGWRWFEEGRDDPRMQGGWLLRHAVLPGQTYEFTAEIAIPKKPGGYLLELGLESMHVTSFAEQGTPPLRIPLQVAHSPPGG
jgi:hypothetical protein